MGSRRALLLVVMQAAARASEPVPGPAESRPNLELRLLPRAEPLAECAGAIVFAEIRNKGESSVHLERPWLNYGATTGEGNSERGSVREGVEGEWSHGHMSMGPMLDGVVGLAPGGSLLVPIRLSTYLVDPARVATGTIQASAGLTPKTNLFVRGPAPWEPIKLEAEANLSIDCGSVAPPSTEGETPMGQGLRLDILEMTEPFVNCDAVLAFALISNTGSENVFLDRELIDQEISVREGTEKRVTQKQGRKGSRGYPPSPEPYLEHIVGLAPGGSALIPIILSELGLDPARREPEILPVGMRLTLRIANRLAPETVQWAEVRLHGSGRVSTMCESD